ncbi:restriction endonuclease subunit S [Pseudoprevotella muciniphila]|uniref:Restriction endonuclease subunit S n=1 Tax=Pseudoprevotella muciniphila TaxID=2133944 RepID=A0A5P8E432_9BACT|nr:restriction endonuclease subunit S [Pseudoprevotella muciniphila]QFQ11753.1 restriction endonuclease subunit S [Pseudoprevotella muciniphila]
MKENWIYRKLEESIEKVKYTTKVQSSDYKGKGLYPIISQEDDMISGYWDNGSDVFKVNKPVVIFGDHTRTLKYIDFDFVLGADGVKILQPIDKLNAKFFLYYLKWCKIPSLGYSRHYKLLKEIQIPIPPLPVQERIVSELDLLSGIIEKKKEQLKEYEQLAQAIFYDMFGDPVMNEKGWEIKKLEEVSTLINGRAYKQDELLDEGKYKVLRVGNFFTNSNYYYSDLELEDNKYCDNGDLLFAWSASFGAFIWNGEKVIYHYHIWKVMFDEEQLNKMFYCYLLNTMTNTFMNDVHGIGMVHLTKHGMEQYNLPLPPLHLQQQFAKKIEAIEKQKELIKQSVKETETLFNSRMDYYFG